MTTIYDADDDADDENDNDDGVLVDMSTGARSKVSTGIWFTARPCRRWIPRFCLKTLSGRFY